MAYQKKSCRRIGIFCINSIYPAASFDKSQLLDRREMPMMVPRIVVRMIPMKETLIVFRAPTSKASA